MASIYTDGFDQYGPPNPNQAPNTALNGEGWNLSYYASVSLVATLNGLSGYALKLGAVSAGSGSMLSRTLPANEVRLIGGARIQSDLFADCGFVFLDGATAQCSVVIENTSGLIAVNLGKDGTLIYRSNDAIASNTAHYLEFDITFGGATGGSTAVWLDGVQIILITAANVTTSNNSANGFGFFNFDGAFSFDDLYIFNANGTYSASVLASNPMVVTQFPVSDEQTQFTNLGNVLGYTYTLYGSNDWYAPSANILFLEPVTANTSCTANSVYVLISSESTTDSTSYIEGVLYSDNAGAPGSLLSGGTPVQGIPKGTWVPLPLASPSALTLGTQYWMGFISNAPSIFYQYLDGKATALGRIAGNTYASGPPATAPTMTLSQGTLTMFVSCSGSAKNWPSVDLNPPVGDLSAVSASSVGISDLYVFPSLPALVEFVYSITVGAVVRVTYAGYREINLNASSSGSGSSGSAGNIVPTVSYLSYGSIFDTDPNTSGTWSVTAANAAFFGMSISE